MITENLSTLKIHKLSQAQYDRELAAGNIDENALYLTPKESGPSVASVNGKTGEVELTASDVGAIALDGETNQLTFNNHITINSQDTNGTVTFLATGSEDDSNEALYLDTMLGNDLRINGVYRVVEDYDVANKVYVDEAVAANKQYVDEAVVASRHTTDEMEHAVLGEELIATNGWNPNGWSGTTSTSTIEFTHGSGNTYPLTFIMPESTAGKLYQISFSSSVPMTTDNLFVRIGNSPLFNLYGQPDPINIGIRAPEDGNLEFIPSSNFTGTLSGFSVRQIIGVFDGNYPITVSDGDVAFSIRTTKASDLDSQNGENNLFIGKNSGQWNTSGYCNVSVGNEAMDNNTSGFWNTAIGYKALEQNTAGSRNIGIGYVALRKNEVGQRNVAIGTHALREHTDGDFNIAIGADAQLEGKKGDANIAIGVGALYHNDGGNHNIAIGYGAVGGGDAGTSRGEDNIVMGQFAAPKVSGENNILLGKQAGYRMTTGKHNVVVGGYSGYGGNIGNVVIGSLNGRNLNEWASSNIILGYSNGDNINSGSYNIIIGRNIPGEGGSWMYHLNIGDLLCGVLAGGTDPHLEVNGGLQLPQVPVEDPGVAGRVWNNSGTLTVSTGVVGAKTNTIPIPSEENAGQVLSVSAQGTAIWASVQDVEEEAY